MPNSPLTDLLLSLPETHRVALRWFEDHTDEVVPWPRPLPDGTLLASKPKGIYKPRWSKYALSVRQSLTGTYPDRQIETGPDGTWSYHYYQEGLAVDDRDAVFTNRGLLNCWQDVVPVGVFIQVKPKPTPRYRILGLALVAGYDEGYFHLEGLARHTVRESHVSLPRGNEATMPQSRADSVAAAFDPRLIEGERRRVFAVIAQRQGQVGFRRTLLRAYGGRCAISGYDAPDALEAAHIVPYRGPVTNHPSNGLLLRADLHTLFDFGLVAVEQGKDSTLRLVVGSEIRKTAYSEFIGRRLSLPNEPRLRPSLAALRHHRELAGI